MQYTPPLCRSPPKRDPIVIKEASASVLRSRPGSPQASVVRSVTSVADSEPVIKGRKLRTEVIGVPVVHHEVRVPIEIEVPVEVPYEVPYEVDVPHEVIREVRVPVERVVENVIERKVEVERRVPQEFETIVEKVVEKRVAVPGPIKFIEKIVEVDAFLSPPFLSGAGPLCPLFGHRRRQVGQLLPRLAAGQSSPSRADGAKACGVHCTYTPEGMHTNMDCSISEDQAPEMDPRHIQFGCKPQTAQTTSSTRGTNDHSWRPHPG